MVGNRILIQAKGSGLADEKPVQAYLEAMNLKTAVEAHRVPFSGREIHGSGAAIRLRRRGQRDRSV
jgi:hypothetical protein